MTRRCDTRVAPCSVPPVEWNLERSPPHKRHKTARKLPQDPRRTRRIAAWEEALLHERTTGKTLEHASPSSTSEAGSPPARESTAVAGAPMPQPKHMRVTWPEERLMWDLFRREPEVRLMPYHLNSFEPPLAKRFALRQWQLMQDEGLSKIDAQNKVNKELGTEKKNLL